jgi:pimeloyl-ACP methyl ester carboxylesterase
MHLQLIEIAGNFLEIQHLTPAPPQEDTRPDPAERAPIVFLHEGLGSLSTWTHRSLNWPQAVCDRSGRAGLVYSRRGYGQSSAPQPPLQADYLHREALEQLPALLSALGLVRPVLLGHSDGASIALLYASALPVSACIALAPHVWVEDMAIAAIEQAKQAFESGDLRNRLARHHDSPELAFWQWNQVWLSPEFRAFDIRAECRSLTAPLLLVQGSGDEYGSFAQLDAIARAAPQAQQLRLAHCGHSPQRDQSEATLAVVENFLRAVP